MVEVNVSPELVLKVIEFQDFSTKVFTGLVLTMIIDGIWINLVSKPLYLAAFSNIMLSPEHMEPHQWMAAIIAWLVLVVGIVMFVLPQTKRTELKHAAALGALYGFVVYSTYEFTNYAIFKYWPISIVAMDVGWGCVFCAGLAAVLTWLHGGD